MPMLDEGLLQPTEPPGFAFDLMVRCEECLRANPPTRVNCLYCGKSLPSTETNAAFQKPALRKLEKWEQGFNNITCPDSNDEVSDELVKRAADLLRLEADDLRRIYQAKRPLPVARAATMDEVSLIERRMADLGLTTVVVSDEALKLEAQPPQRMRAFELNAERLIGHHLASAGLTSVGWSDISLVVQARLFVKEVELRERKSRRAENDIVAARESATDEAVFDLYSQKEDGPWRIAANSFDFSCLGDRKSLLAVDNFTRLIALISERVPHVEIDDSYRVLRHALEPVWPTERQTEARGWHRDRPGKYSTGEAVISSNESQFTRYSRLCHYLKLNPLNSLR
jgi:hypothetical protein